MKNISVQIWTNEINVRIFVSSKRSNEAAREKQNKMTTRQIIDQIKGGTSADVQAAFQQAEKESGNFSARFGKTWQYWSHSNWSVVVKEVKKYL